MNRRQKNLMVRWMNESMKICGRFGTDDGNRPVDMDICDYWLQLVNNWPDRVVQYRKLAEPNPKPKPKAKPYTVLDDGSAWTCLMDDDMRPVWTRTRLPWRLHSPLSVPTTRPIPSE